MVGCGQRLAIDRENYSITADLGHNECELRVSANDTTQLIPSLLPCGGNAILCTTSCTKSEKREKVNYMEAKYVECAFNGGHRWSSGDSQSEGR